MNLIIFSKHIKEHSDDFLFKRVCRTRSSCYTKVISKFSYDKKKISSSFYVFNI